MGQESFKKLNIKLVLSLSTWALIIVISLALNVLIHQKQIENIAVSEAKAHFNKDQAFRLWATQHGGVYVPETEKTPANPYLSHIPDRDIKKPDGTDLTLMNPAYMVRQLNEDSENLFNAKGKITSLKPLRPENAPDSWEIKALKSFEQGRKSLMEFVTTDLGQYLRYMEPMYVKPGCLKCHGHQGYKAGDVRGGVAVTIAVNPISQTLSSSIRNNIFLHLAVGVLGMIGILTAYFFFRKKTLEKHRIQSEMEKDKALLSHYNDIAQTILLELDPEGNILNINRKGAELLECSRSSAIGKNWFDHFILSEDRDRMHTTMEKIASGEILPYTYVENIVVSAKGQQKFIGWYTSVIKNENGDIRGIISSGHDITENKNLLSKLKENEERFRFAIENAYLGTWDWDIPSGNVIFNTIWAEMLGYTLKEVTPEVSCWENLVHPDDLEETIQILNNHLQGDTEVYSCEHRLKHKKGYWIWVMDKGKVIERDKEGNPLRAIGIHMDITELKQLELEKTRYNTQMNQAQSIAKSGHWFLDLENNTLEWSDEIYRIFGVEPQSFKANYEAFLEFVHPDDIEMVDTAYKTSLKNQQPYEIVHRIISKDGTLKFVEEKCFSKFDKTGKALNSLGTVTDVTEKIMYEKQIEAEELKYKELVEKSGIAVIIEDVDHSIVYYNDPFLKLFGYSEDELNEKSLKHLIHPDDRILMEKKHTERHAEMIVNDEFEFRGITKDNRTIHIMIKTSPQFDNGTLTATRCYLWDITKRKQMEEEQQILEKQIQHTQKLESLGVLAGGIAHDFNNILMAILGNADLALMELPETSPAVENLKSIEHSSRQAADLCRQMLAYSGKGKFEISDINLSELIEEMKHMLNISISKSIECHYRLSEPMMLFEGDPAQIRQIVMNLVINASESIENKTGVISITTECMYYDSEYLDSFFQDNDSTPPGHYCCLEVSDSGCGMDKDTVKKMFDPFFTTKFTGRGLGMSAVLGIIRSHKGTIKVESTKGTGTTIRILFPGKEKINNGKTESVNPSEQKEALTGTILIADDEESIRKVAASLLSKMGFNVLTASDGNEALEMFRENQKSIDCVILDLTMPGLNGEDTFKKIRAIDSEVKVVLSSGYNAMEIKTEFSDRGLAGFIQKPYRFNDMKSILTDLLNTDKGNRP